MRFSKIASELHLFEFSIFPNNKIFYFEIQNEKWAFKINLQYTYIFFEKYLMGEYRPIISLIQRHLEDKLLEIKG